MPENYLTDSQEPNQTSLEESDLRRSPLDQPEDKYRHLEANVSQEKALLAVIKKIKESLNLESLFQTVVAEVRDCLKVDRVAIYKFAPVTENTGIQPEIGFLASRVTAYPPGEFVCENVGKIFPSALGMKIPHGVGALRLAPCRYSASACALPPQKLPIIIRGKYGLLIILMQRNYHHGIGKLWGCFCR